MKVLVVEDDRDLRATLVDILEGQGYLVAAVDDADEALEILSRDPPQLVLLDLVPPYRIDRTGMRSLCARLRAMGTPTIVITSMMTGDGELPIAGRVLRKPFGLDALLDALVDYPPALSRPGFAAR